MKHLLIYFQILLTMFFTIHPMEIFYNRFSLLPTELFKNIMILATPIPTKPTKEDIKTFFCLLYSRCTVCKYWYKKITEQRNWYAAYFNMLPLHVAALINDIMSVVNLKIYNKAQLYQKDTNGFMINDYAHKDIKFIIEQYCRPITTYPRNEIIRLYEKKIKQIRKIKVTNKRKFNCFLNIIILEHTIHHELDLYAMRMHIRVFDTLISMKGNINAYDETGKTLLDKTCRVPSILPYLTVLLAKAQVREYILKENNAQKTLKTCIKHENVAAMEKICALKDLNLRNVYPDFVHFFLIKKGMFSASKGSPIEAFIKTLDLDWEIVDQEQKHATPLMLLMNTNRQDLVRWLLKEKKINPNIQNKNGNTALHFAAKTRKPNKKIINLLLHYDANPFLKNKEGKIPVNLAKNDANKVVLLQKMLRIEKRKT